MKCPFFTRALSCMDVVRVNWEGSAGSSEIQGRAIKRFECPCRLDFVTGEMFLKEIEGLGRLGLKEITPKTGAYSAVELAIKLRYGSEAKIDLLTIDGASSGGGTGQWPMMSEWDIPAFYLRSPCLSVC